MAEEEKNYSKNLLGKTVVTKTGKRFGEVGNLTFEVRTGELMQIILRNPTTYTEGLDLEKDSSNNLLLPYSAVIAIGDFVVVSEEDIIVELQKKKITNSKQFLILLKGIIDAGEETLYLAIYNSNNQRSYITVKLK